ncbi:hypothetical protein TIFTF001_020962 [Ficus carica]|uniref:Uncharacterized protein n=1 Tax=Ficus carica TaxID=3494 RepID=A0AA88AS50_FICCA|nr:hypothetical protein TIFTF001_020962 [Ficus carica]
MSSSSAEWGPLAVVAALMLSIESRTCFFGNWIQVPAVYAFVDRWLPGCSLSWTEVALEPWGCEQWLESREDSKAWLAASPQYLFPLSILSTGCSSTSKQPVSSLSKRIRLVILEFPSDVEASG